MIIYEEPVKPISATELAESNMLTDDDEGISILITREAFTEYFVLTLPSGITEEFETPETVKFLVDRGANKRVVEKVLDHVWNFRKGILYIKKAIDPSTKLPPNSILPRIT